MESTLSLQLSDIAARVGDMLGYGTLTTSWSGWQAASPYVPDPALVTSQLQQIMNSIAQGLRWFYTPPLIDRSIVAHEWSFLTQLREIAIVAGQNTYTLPDDYRGLMSPLTYAASANQWVKIERKGIGVLNSALQTQFTMTGTPSICAIYVMPVQGTIGQRWQIAFAPVPNANFTVTGQFRVLPQMLTVAKSYPLGGAAHADTIMEACLAAADMFYNESIAGHMATFKERLVASISMDVQENVPSNAGYCGDASDGYDTNWRRQFANEPLYNGVPFSQL